MIEFYAILGNSRSLTHKIIEFQNYNRQERAPVFKPFTPLFFLLYLFLLFKISFFHSFQYKKKTKVVQQCILRCLLHQYNNSKLILPKRNYLGKN